MPVNDFYGSRPSLNVAASKTLALTDCGTVQVVTVDAQTLTLPSAASTAAGTKFTVKVGGNNGDVTVLIAPNSADAVAGLGFTATVNKGVQSLKATGIAGDEIELTCSGAAGTSAWTVSRASGSNWTRVP